MKQARCLRALINANRIIINKGGKYLLHLPQFSMNRGLAQREAMTQTLAEKVKARFSVDAGYFSVLGSEDPNDIPYYNTDFLDNRLFYNCS